jgi:hypothetical protein
MRRHRRLVLINRYVPLLAAFVGLLALAGAVIVQLNAQAGNAAVMQELARLRVSLDLMAQRTTEVEKIADATAANGAIEALLALQDRMNRIEGEWTEQQEALAAAAAAPPALAAVDPNAPASDPNRRIDPSWPTTDCIPLGTRFMVVPNESFPICQSPAVVRATGITNENVAFDGAGVVAVNGIGTIAGTTCTVNVLTASVDGFAELRVSCS